MIYHSSIVTQNAVYLENNSILENSNNPNDPITLQIAKVANSKKLSGKKIKYSSVYVRKPKYPHRIYSKKRSRIN